MTGAEAKREMSCGPIRKYKMSDCDRTFIATRIVPRKILAWNMIAWLVMVNAGGEWRLATDDDKKSLGV